MPLLERLEIGFSPSIATEASADWLSGLNSCFFDHCPALRSLGLEPDVAADAFPPLHPQLKTLKAELAESKSVLSSHTQALPPAVETLQLLLSDYFTAVDLLALLGRIPTLKDLGVVCCPSSDMAAVRSLC